MIYICDKCGNSFDGNPAYLAYGLKKGEPFIEKLCKKCVDESDSDGHEDQ